MIKNNKPRKVNASPEFGVDSRYKNRSEKLSDGKRLMEARLKRLNSLPRRQVVKAKLLQLKIQMEEYLKEPAYKENNYFTSFLSNYIDTIYDKRIMFAKDVSITPVSLSQILNKHREPKEEFMLRLMLHSELAFKNICEFPKRTWYEVYYHEKICETMASQNEWKPEEKRHVKIENAILN